MISRPKRSRFAGHIYSVAFCPVSTLLVDGNEAWGETDHAAREIRIEDGLHPDKERTIVMHEILHQVLELSNVALDEDVEEKVCTALGDALIGHMRDNVGLWRYLLQKAK